MIPGFTNNLVQIIFCTAPKNCSSKIMWTGLIAVLNVVFSRDPRAACEEGCTAARRPRRRAIKR